MTSPGRSQPIPDLDEFLERPKNFGPCAYVRAVPPDVRAKIDAKVDQGQNRWAAFRAWLELQDIEVKHHWIDNHYKQGHPHDK